MLILLKLYSFFFFPTTDSLFISLNLVFCLVRTDRLDTHLNDLLCIVRAVFNWGKKKETNSCLIYGYAQQDKQFQHGKQNTHHS